MDYEEDGDVGEEERPSKPAASPAARPSFAAPAKAARPPAKKKDPALERREMLLAEEAQVLSVRPLHPSRSPAIQPSDLPICGSFAHLRARPPNRSSIGVVAGSPPSSSVTLPIPLVQLSVIPIRPPPHGPYPSIFLFSAHLPSGGLSV
jgi:hypothetical protein